MESENYKKACKVTKYLLQDTKYLYTKNIGGIYTSLMHYGVNPGQDAIDGMKDGIIDIFFDGLEPEWYNKEAYEWWENMTPEYFYSGSGEWKNNRLYISGCLVVEAPPQLFS